MNLKERPLVFGLVAACIAGIVLVGLLLIFVGGALFPPGVGFSEVFFLNSEKLPKVIAEGEPMDFSVMVASHHNKKVDYTYEVITGDTIIQSGAFSLPNDSIAKKDRYNKTISITNVKLKSTLTKITNATLTTTQNTYNGGLGLLLSPKGNDAQMVSDPSLIYYPVQLPVGSDKATLIFNPKNTETFHTITTSRTNIGNIREFTQSKSAVDIEGFRITDAGYDLSQTEWTIQNNQGIITASSKTVADRFRYSAEKIAVEVTSYPANDPDSVTKYEIYFWVVVSDNQ